MSLRVQNGTMLQTLLRPREGTSVLAQFTDGDVTEHASVSIEGHDYVPYSPLNNLLTHRVVVLPSDVGEYESEIELVEVVQAFIHRYVDLSPAFEEIATHYVLLTWCYDLFNELPYLRVRGPYGSGKSRFLLTIGSLCFKPIFASGASTVSPLFRLIDQVGGTLVIDEADFWASDERSEIVKILNNGNARGFPVLRSEVTPQKEFSPRAFNIFGPKLVATRHPYEDAALESRCLTEVLGGRPMRSDIPISLPRAFEAEAEDLRNKLLTYRFRRCSAPIDLTVISTAGLEPRRAQIVAALLSVATNDDTRERIRAFANGRMDSGQGRDADIERSVLSSVQFLLRASSIPLTLAAIAKQIDSDWGRRSGVEVENRWVGSVLRRLGLRPQKSGGVYMIPTSEYPRVRELLDQHGLTEPSNDDVGVEIPTDTDAAPQTPTR
jgi:hypothetical protein